MIRAFEDYLQGGGYPELVGDLDPGIKRRILQEYFDVMIYRDLVERHGTANLAALRLLIRRLVDGVGSSMSINKIHNDLKSAGYRIGKNALYDWLDQLETICFVQIARKFDPSVVRQELAERKAYVVDNGFLHAMSYRYSGNHEKLLENLIAMELRKKGLDLLFFKGDQECDFVVVNDAGQARSLQVAYDLASPDIRKREIRALVRASRAAGSTDAFLVTMDQEEDLLVDGVAIAVRPAWKLLALWDQAWADPATP
ncbi:MAG: DUF4143 domain-containing protein [Thermodesulfobacteriota bacterium]